MPGRLFKDDISIVLGGEAGQGIQTLEYVLTHVLKNAGYSVFAAKEYMSRVRGGSNSTEIRVGSRPPTAFLNRIDILIPLDAAVIPHLEMRLTPDTLIIGDHKSLASNRNIIDIPFSALAEKLGNAIYANAIAAGAVFGLFNESEALIQDFLKRHFADKPEDVIAKNLEAVKMGLAEGRAVAEREGLTVTIAKAAKGSAGWFLSGGDAVGLGALAGGCNVIASYPMSPGTSVLNFLAKYSGPAGVVVEQAEDEIAAINLGLGAWYAGGRAMVTTSGGGFALMCEGVSLAGMVESPMVIHIGQRPGPATGLPTRTEQGDLNLALYSGHGDFPRILFAPGTPEDAFELTRLAFRLADQYQVPVFVLTDQFLIDALYKVESLNLEDVNIPQSIVETGPDYHRYRLTENGLSPRGIPGLGTGFVDLDSDEHDEEGHITESMEIRNQMVEKRKRKAALLQPLALAPLRVGPDAARKLIICWGSTFHAVKEAMEQLNRQDIALLHFKQVYPLHSSTLGLLQDAEKVIIIENNVSGQFASLIRLITGFNIEKKILKYDGMPFSVEEIGTEIRKFAE